MLMSLSALEAIPVLNGCALTTQGSLQSATTPFEESLSSNKALADNLDERENSQLTNAAFYEPQTLVQDVIDDEAFEDYGRLLFPVTGYHAPDASTTLATLGLKLSWYNFYDVATTIDVLSYLKDDRLAGRRIFYPIYAAEEIAADPSKADTGLFHFRAQDKNEPRPFAICNAGGGFSYVAAIHDSFPHAYELSKRDYHGFALIYRPGWDTAMEDLARAIAVVYDHADELGIDAASYSLWGGSAGARMAATLGAYGPAAFAYDLPKPGAVIMQYTGHREYSADDPPTYACVGTSDGIADWRVMQARLEAMERMGIPTEFHVYEGLPHGFGLGIGTVAAGWINDAVTFWEAQMPK